MNDALRLPIDDYQDVIEAAVRQHPVVVLTAETGAGKSTRVPLWLWRQGKRVAVTQPRRIAARALSQYVAGQAGVPWGGAIGYVTGFDRRVSAETTLVYQTDGVQMVQEIRGRNRAEVLILDEIHEWNLNQEVLIGLVRRALDDGSLRRQGRRVVVMSATLRGQQLSAFFRDAPVISVPGRGFPVQHFFRKGVFALPDVAALLEEGHNVLAFLPGKQEIDDFIRELKTLTRGTGQPMIFPLHAELPLADQARVFAHYDVPKVVVATDVAQTSLTIDDIDVVVDLGLKKEIRLVNGIEGLYPTDISRAESEQRAGRAGRTRPGMYILCSENGPAERPEFPTPEIERLNLEAVVLRMRSWDLDPLDFPFFHRPNRTLVKRAMAALTVFGALDERGKVTADGRRMVNLPVSVRAARLLIEAERGGESVLMEALRVIAILETKGITSRDYVGQRIVSGGDQADLLNQLAIWQGWRQNRALISQKKMALAREVLGELKRRLAPREKPKLPPGGPRNRADALFSAILSAFCDGVYTRQGTLYVREGEERQLDRASILAEARPEWIVGLPFDLVSSRDDPLGGGREDRMFSLLTFCSELSLARLEELKPFSYQRRAGVVLEGERLSFRAEIVFGGRVIHHEERDPAFADPAEADTATGLAVEWLLGERPPLPLDAEIDRLRRQEGEVRAVLGESLPPFDVLLRRFLLRVTRHHLNVGDLPFFFRFQPAFTDLHWGRLLPLPLLRRLRRANWPATVELDGAPHPLHRRRGLPYLELDDTAFRRLAPNDLRLPTGERAGVKLGESLFFDWTAAVADTNRRWQEELFAARWRERVVPVAVEDAERVGFPLAVEGGKGMAGVVFEFFAVPEVGEGGAVLRHFLTREEADECATAGRERWQEFVMEQRRKSIEAVFRDKGWRVK
ncbi:MAG TPA: helicase-related protein [Candidatus Aminicenantes bacterium]|nr:helicase-related protein [Candidatus Aminicenantes bacterium]